MQQILGDYKILKQIGQGPLGIALLAEHRFIKKPYILKVLPEELTKDQHFMALFEEEVAKLAKFEHPHLVKIHNISSSDGLYFLVTDYIEGGQTLGEYMAKQGQLEESELLHITQAIADLLDKAHGLHLHHGYLKLNNVIVDPQGKIFISDLGLSKILPPQKVAARTVFSVCEALQLELSCGEKYHPSPIKTDALGALSTSFVQQFAFLAPEQKQMRGIGEKTDAYAFGVMVYYLIAGSFPEGVFDPPSELAPTYQHDWDEVIMQCMASSPKRRPATLLPLLTKKRSATVELLKERLKETVAMQPVVAQPASTPPAAAQSSNPQHSASQSFATHSTEKTPSPESVALLKESVETTFQPPPPTVVPFKPEPIKVEPTPEVSAPVVSSIVEKKDLSEATPPPMTPPPDETYSKVIGSMLNREPVVTEYQPSTSGQANLEPIETDMVMIPEGEYMRGSNDGNRDEMPVHQIQLKAFALDTHPVTNEQFMRFLEFNRGEKDEHYNDLIRLKESRISRSSGNLSIEAGYAKHPVVGVTWYGASAYAAWVGKRLPMEAEWEVAACGGAPGSPFPTGETIEKSGANFFSSDTAPVMSFAPNPYGVYDLAGNVYEWCSDWYGYNYYEISAQEPNQPTGPQQGVYRVLRGGCWKSLKEDMRCSHRHRNNPGTVNGTYGFRCAADVN